MKAEAETTKNKPKQKSKGSLVIGGPASSPLPDLFIAHYQQCKGCSSHFPTKDTSRPLKLCSIYFMRENSL